MTRCNIVVNDSEDTLYLYHHCDGYPKGVGKELIEYLQTNTPKTADEVHKGLVFMYGESYEETEGIHGDISYLYTERAHRVVRHIEPEGYIEDPEGIHIDADRLSAGPQKACLLRT